MYKKISFAAALILLIGAVSCDKNSNLGNEPGNLVLPATGLAVEIVYTHEGIPIYADSSNYNLMNQITVATLTPNTSFVGGVNGYQFNQAYTAYNSQTYTTYEWVLAPGPSTQPTQTVLDTVQSTITWTTAQLIPMVDTFGNPITLTINPKTDTLTSIIQNYSNGSSVLVKCLYNDSVVIDGNDPPYLPLSNGFLQIEK